MPLARVFTVTDDAIINATIAVWKDGRIPTPAFMRCVSSWKRKGLIPVDWSPYEGDDENGEVEAEGQVKR